MNINKVIIGGNIATEISSREAGESTVYTFVLINNQKFGEKEDKTVVEVNAWNKTGEVISKYAGKGSLVLVEGRLKFDSWETEEGEKRTKLSINADRIFLGPKKSGSKEDGEERASSKAVAKKTGTKPTGKPVAKKSSPAKVLEETFEDEFADLANLDPNEE